MYTSGGVKNDLVLYWKSGLKTPERKHPVLCVQLETAQVKHKLETNEWEK